MSRVRFGAVLDAKEVLGRQTPNLEQAPTAEHETLHDLVLLSSEEPGGNSHSPRLLHQPSGSVHGSSTVTVLIALAVRPWASVAV